MRRIVGYFAELATSVATSWSHFWFIPADPAPLGLIRVLTGLMLVYTHAIWGLDLHAFVGEEGWMGEAATRSIQQGQFIFSYLWYVPSEWLEFAHWAALAVFVLFTLGVCTRITSILSFFILINYAHRAPAALFGLDQINALLTMYLAVGPSGAAYSIDRLFSRYRMARRALASDPVSKLQLAPPASTGANVALRLIQLHMCVIYLFAGLSKLLGEAWWDGTAIWRVAASYEYQSADLTWLAYAPLLVNVLTHLTAFFELSYCALIWPRLTRPLMLALAFGMHLAIGVSMGMMTFGLIMIIANFSFTPAPFVRGLTMPLIRGRRTVTVIYDGACKLCMRSMSLLKSFDIGDQVSFVDYNRFDPQTVHPQLTPDSCITALQVVVHDGKQLRLLSGYWGFKAVVRNLRLLWPFVPLLSIPGVGLVGPMVYRLIARRRARRLGFQSDSCAMHSGGFAAPVHRGRAPVTLTIRLPEDAKLFVQNELYPGKGRKRRFTSTPARMGKDYVFNLRVETERDGVTVSMSQEVRLRAGQHSEVRFWLGEPDAAHDNETGNGQRKWDRITAPESKELCFLQPMEKSEAES